jgi:hypothetical protein
MKYLDLTMANEAEIRTILVEAGFTKIRKRYSSGYTPIISGDRGEMTIWVEVATGDYQTAEFIEGKRRDTLGKIEDLGKGQ